MSDTHAIRKSYIDRRLPAQVVIRVVYDSGAHRCTADNDKGSPRVSTVIQDRVDERVSVDAHTTIEPVNECNRCVCQSIDNGLSDE